MNNYNPHFDLFANIFPIAVEGYLDKETKNLIFEVEMPGFKREELKVSTDEKKRLIVIDAISKRNRKQKYVYVSRDYDLSSVNAKLDLGVLTLTVSKLDSAESRKFIEVT